MKMFSGFEVTMNQPLAMCVGYTFADLQEYFQSVEGRSKVIVVFFQRAAFVVRHDEVGPLVSACFSASEAPNHVGMIEVLSVTSIS